MNKFALPTQGLCQVCSTRYEFPSVEWLLTSQKVVDYPYNIHAPLHPWASLDRTIIIIAQKSTDG